MCDKQIIKEGKMKFKTAIIGCGLISQTKYLPIMTHLKNVEVVGICDLNKELLWSMGKKYEIKNLYTDLEQLLKEQKPDIVVVATPTKTHCDIAVKSIKKGAHVLIEKPMALTVEECDKIIETAEKYNRKVGVMHNQIFNPAFLKAIESVKGLQIGKFVGIRILLATSIDDFPSDKNHWTHKLPAGVIDETGPHGIYLALAFLKNVTSLNVRFKKLLDEYPWLIGEDFEVQLEGENGLGSIRFLYGSKTTDTWIEIFGTNGFIKVDLQSRKFLRFSRPNLDAKTILFSELKVMFQSTFNLIKNSLGYLFSLKINPHYNGIIKFIDWISGKSDYPSDAKQGREVVRLMEKINKEILKIKDKKNC